MSVLDVQLHRKYLDALKAYRKATASFRREQVSIRKEALEKLRSIKLNKVRNEIGL